MDFLLYALRSERIHTNDLACCTPRRGFLGITVGRSKLCLNLLSKNREVESDYLTTSWGISHSPMNRIGETLKVNSRSVCEEKAWSCLGDTEGFIP